MTEIIISTQVILEISYAHESTSAIKKNAQLFQRKIEMKSLNLSTKVTRGIDFQMR